MASRQTIDPPVPQPPAYGLIPVATILNDLAGVDWMRGIQYLPFPCPAAGGVVAIDCDVFDTAIPADDTWPDQPDVVEHDPFVVYEPFRCSTFGMRREEYEDRARRALDLTWSAKVAGQLWTAGLDANAAESDTLTAAVDGAVGVTEGVSMLDWALGRAGRRGMIHVTPQVLSIAVAEGVAVRPQGAVWTSPMGNVIVSDAGYTGTGPGGTAVGATQWAYGSSMVEVVAGPISIDGLTPDVVAATNTAQLVAYRPVLLRWDPCGLAAVELAVAVPEFAGAT